MFAYLVLLLTLVVSEEVQPHAAECWFQYRSPMKGKSTIDRSIEDDCPM